MKLVIEIEPDDMHRLSDLMGRNENLSFELTVKYASWGGEMFAVKV